MKKDARWVAIKIHKALEGYEDKLWNDLTFPCISFGHGVEYHDDGEVTVTITTYGLAKWLKDSSSRQPTANSAGDIK